MVNGYHSTMWLMQLIKPTLCYGDDDAVLEDVTGVAGLWQWNWDLTRFR